jgi:hypothetical protein
MARSINVCMYVYVGYVVREALLGSPTLQFQAAASGSNKPTISPPPSGRMYVWEEGSSITGQLGSTSAMGSVMR